MKSTWFRGAGAAAILAGAGMLASAATTGARPVESVIGNETVQGVVTAVADDSLTVDNRAVIAVSPATACIHNGQTMMLSDLNVGDRVSVAAFHDPGTEHRQAILIDVVARTGNGSPEPAAGY